MDPFNWGIIGPGNIATDFANDLQFIHAVPQQIKAVLAHTTESGERFSKKFSVEQVFTDIRKFLDVELDAIYIATPHTLHYEQAKACLQHRIPVLCEKPITINTEQLEDLLKLSRETNTFLMEGMWTRFLPSVKKVLDLLQEDKIGKIISVRANMNYRAPHDKSNRFFNPDLGGGSLLDLGIYPVFLASLLLGKPYSIKAAAIVSEEGIDQACSILMNYNNDQYAILESSLITQTELVAEIAGEKGRIRILSPWTEMPAGLLLEIYDEVKMEFPCKWEGKGFQFETGEVIQCIQQKRIESPLMPHSLSLEVMKIMDEVRRQVNVKYKKFE
jgi:predicted dehydrogenase